MRRSSCSDSSRSHSRKLAALGARPEYLEVLKHARRAILGRVRTWRSPHSCGDVLARGQDRQAAAYGCMDQHRPSHPIGRLRFMSYHLFIGLRMELPSWLSGYRTLKISRSKLLLSVPEQIRSSAPASIRVVAGLDVFASNLAEAVLVAAGGRDACRVHVSCARSSSRCFVVPNWMATCQPLDVTRTPCIANIVIAGFWAVAAGACSYLRLPI